MEHIHDMEKFHTQQIMPLNHQNLRSRIRKRIFPDSTDDTKMVTTNFFQQSWRSLFFPVYTIIILGRQHDGWYIFIARVQKISLLFSTNCCIILIRLPSFLCGAVATRVNKMSHYLWGRSQERKQLFYIGLSI